MSKHNLLQAAFTRGLALEGDLYEELSELGDYEIDSLADAEALTRGMEEFVRRPTDSDEAVSAFGELARLFQSVTSAEAFRYLTLRGIPLLIEAYDARLVDPGESEGDLLFALKIFARYGTVEGLDRVVSAAHSGALCDGFLWSVIFEQLNDADPLIPDLVRRLSHPLPAGFVSVALLDWTNRLCRDKIISSHPFNIPEGIASLRGWLASSDEDEFSFAHASTAALPFIGDPPRTELMALAMDHADLGIQMEAAWATAYLGSDSGVKFLARLCLDPHVAITARVYLQELRRSEAIPDEANDPDFVAMAEMCNWLAHPQEFGRPPDEIELYDTREMFWPPTNDWRPLWLFKYRYHNVDDEERSDADHGSDDDGLSNEDRGSNEADAESIGVGMTGSITFSLIDEASPQMPADDIYALHCCWELEAIDDPCAPVERSIEAGRALIDAAQSDEIDDDEKF